MEDKNRKYFLVAFILSLNLISISSVAQQKCPGPQFCATKIISSKAIKVSCRTVTDAYAYRTRIKSPGDSVWQYFMVNAPDTLMIIPIKKPEPVFIIQMGAMCSANLADTSAFSIADTLLTNCNCEWPAFIQAKIIDSTTVKIEWTATMDAKQFKLFYEPMSSKLKQWQSVTVNATAYPEFILTNLKPDTDYLFSLKSICYDPRRGVSPLVTPYIKFKTSK